MARGSLCLGAVVLALAAVCSKAAQKEEEKLIGWRGDTYKPRYIEEPHTWLELISWKPRAYVFHNFITEAEAKHIVELAWPQMQRSTVVGENGSSVLDDYRTSYGTFLYRHQTPVIKAVEDRIALLTHLPVVNQEDMQVLRYGVGQYYHAHEDSLDDESPRMATVLVYLSNGEPGSGGETSFPESSAWANPGQAAAYDKDFSTCAKGKVAFIPKRGDALLFYSYAPDGKTPDHASTHEGCPVNWGSKWTTTTWIHTKPFRPEAWNGTHFNGEGATYGEPVASCRDTQKDCKLWAKSGECEKNTVYMKEACKVACNVCEPCKKGDKECENRNRRRMNLLVYDPKELGWADEGGNGLGSDGEP